MVLRRICSVEDAFNVVLVKLRLLSSCHVSEFLIYSLLRASYDLGYLRTSHINADYMPVRMIEVVVIFCLHCSPLPDPGRNRDP